MQKETETGKRGLWRPGPVSEVNRGSQAPLNAKENWPQRRHYKFHIGKVAEGMGFEPTIRHYPYNGLANRRLQPLGHPSTDEWVRGVCKGQPSVLGWDGQLWLTTS